MVSSCPYYAAAGRLEPTTVGWNFRAFDHSRSTEVNMQAQRRGRASQLDGVRQYVGVKSDREVAEMVGLTPSAVQMYRKKHGIAPSGITGRKAKPKPVVARPAAAKVAPLPEPEKVAKT